MADDEGYDGVALTVGDGNPDARRLYERIGFVHDTAAEGRSLMIRRS